MISSISRYAIFNRWTVIAVIIAAITVLPSFYMASSWLQDSISLWQIFSPEQLWQIVWNTLLLSLSVGFGTLIVGVSLGWIIAMYDFPGRTFFAWTLCLPLSFPAYVFGFLYLGLLDYSGPLQSLLRGYFQFTGSLPIRSLMGLSFVLTLSLYPYVYLLSKQAFSSQSTQIQDSVRLMGTPPWKAFKDFALPLSKPWILSALIIVAMECFADFGTVTTFSYNTFTTAIYKAWYGYFSIESAAQLSSLLGLIALGLILSKNYLSRNNHYANLTPERKNLLTTSPKKQWICLTYCFFIWSLSIGIPLITLISWSYKDWRLDTFADLAPLILHTIYIGLITSFVIILFAILLSLASRFRDSSLMKTLVSISCMGYGIPGAVFAVGTYFALFHLSEVILSSISYFNINPDEISPLTMTILPLVLGLYTRFFAIGFQPIQDGLKRISLAQDEAANLMGGSSASIYKHIHHPQLKTGLTIAFILSFLEVAKEMPLTVMTRPFGWDTLSVRIFELTSEGEWTQAALPSLFLFCIGFIPVLLMKNRT